MSRWSFELGRLFGISVRVHATFALLIVWILHVTLSGGGSAALALASLLFVGLIFSFVVMHEYGHALMARRFGIRTREITLLPIGGMAHLERLPDKPVEQLWVALAGPAVNFAIAATGAMLLWMATGGVNLVLEDGLLGSSMLAMIIRINLVMGIFNLLPALPMDGGRVLKALLALRMSNLRATKIASGVAKTLAIAMGVFGLAQGQTILALIATFVWLAASAEQRDAEHRAMLESAISWGPAEAGEDEWIAGTPSGAQWTPGRRVRVIMRDADGRTQVRWLRLPAQS
jgi:Zn-dependent protease